MKLLFITWNKNKLQEARELLPNFEIENKAIDLIEIQGTAEEIAIHKIQSAFDLVKKPCFIEDTALFFEEWGNALPWPYIKDFVKYIGTKNLTNLLKNNFNATARTTIAYHDGEKIHLMIGEKKWKIVHHCGIDSFARDPIFQPEGSAITYAEMKLEEKNQISHRFIAFQNFRKILGYE